MPDPHTKASGRHRLYIATILGKGALGLLQLATSAAVQLGVLQQLPRFVQWLVERELSEDPNGFLATRLLTWANLVPTSDTGFYTLYFAAHGALHVLVVAALLWGASWAHHVAITVLGLFVVYQLFEWTAVGGKMLLILTAIDLVVIYLTFLEARDRAKRQ